MNSTQILKTIEEQHKLLYVPNISKVETSSLVRHGYFVDFDDAVELKEQGRVRFITNANWGEFNKDKNKRRESDPNAKADPKYSVVLNAKDITNLSVVSYLNR
jgi:hypothetical protein